MSALHPITRRVVAALATDELLDPGELRAIANLIVDARDGAALGGELIALAQRLTAVEWVEAVEQVVVLSGLALGDAAGSTIATAATPRTSEPPAARARPSAPPPANAVHGGPAARAALEGVVDRGAAGLEPEYTPAPEGGEVAKPRPKRKIF